MPSVTLPGALAVAGGAGAGISAFGQYETGQANAAAANYQAQVAQNNARIALENAQLAAAEGAAKESAIGMKTAAGAGTAKAAQGASGIDPNTGSAAGVRQAIGKLGALDIGTQRANTATQVWGYEVAATSDTAQAGLLEQEASQAGEAGDISALGTFLSGASSVGSKYAPLQPQPQPPTVPTGG